jgi:hypothetical protein
VASLHTGNQGLWRSPIAIWVITNIVLMIDLIVVIFWELIGLIFKWDFSIEAISVRKGNYKHRCSRGQCSNCLKGNWSTLGNPNPSECCIHTAHPPITHPSSTRHPPVIHPSPTRHPPITHPSPPRHSIAHCSSRRRPCPLDRCRPHLPSTTRKTRQPPAAGTGLPKLLQHRVRGFVFGQLVPIKVPAIVQKPDLPAVFLQEGSLELVA